MPYIFAVIAMGAFLAGFGVSDGIAAQNKEAELTLATLTQAAGNARATALNANKQLEDANVSAINAINSQHDAFKSQRMYDTGRKSDSCTPTTGNNTTGTANTATEYAPELSDELTNFLRVEVYRVDQIEVYTIMCQKFVTVNNCGINK